MILETIASAASLYSCPDTVAAISAVLYLGFALSLRPDDYMRPTANNHYRLRGCQFAFWFTDIPTPIFLHETSTYPPLGTRPLRLSSLSDKDKANQTNNMIMRACAANPTTPNRASSFYFSTSSANSLAWDPTMLFLQNPIFYSFICSRRLHTEVHCSPSRPQPCSTSPPRSSCWRLHSYWRHWRYSTRPKTFWLLAQKFSGVNVSSIGSTLSKDAAVIPINDYKIINASKLSSSSVKSHVATYYTTHNRASYAVCKICYDSKDNNGTVHVKNCTDNTKNHAELRAFLNPANTAAVVLLRDSWPSAEEYEGQEKHRVLYCRFFVLVVNCRFLFLLISDIFVLIDF